MKRCKVKGCNNSVMEIKKKHPNMKGCYGYCQIHNIEGLVKEEGEK